METGNKENVFSARIQNKVDTLDRWNESDLILKKGELAFVSEDNSFKIGDGEHKFNELTFVRRDRMIPYGMTPFFKFDGTETHISETENITISDKNCILVHSNDSGLIRITGTSSVPQTVYLFIRNKTKPDIIYDVDSQYVFNTEEKFVMSFSLESEYEIGVYANDINSVSLSDIVIHNPIAMKQVTPFIDYENITVIDKNSFIERKNNGKSLYYETFEAEMDGFLRIEASSTKMNIFTWGIGFEANGTLYRYKQKERDNTITTTFSPLGMYVMKGQKWSFFCLTGEYPSTFFTYVSINMLPLIGL